MSQINHFFDTYPIIEQSLLFTFYVVSAVQVFYYLFFYLRVFFFKKDSSEIAKNRVPISIIIAAHNEADNLRTFLPIILEQNYPDFEVIVVNDRSEDETDEIIANFQKKYKHLRSTFIKNNGKLKHGKKLAITLGIKAAKHDYILLTDADCEPISELWIEETVKHFQESDIVLGYGPYFKERTFLNKLIRFDTMFIALQYMTFAKGGFPYMGIGRNLAYKKSLFIENRGLASHAHIASGDDDLFINEVAHKHEIALSFQENSFVYSVPKKTFKYWIRQKQRHFSTFGRYKNKHLLLLSGEVVSRVLFYLLFFVLLLSNLTNYYFWGIAAFRMILSFVILVKASLFFREKKLSLFLILFDFVFPLLNFFVYLEQKITQKNRW